MQAAIKATMIHLGAKVNAFSELDDIDALVRLYRPRLLRYVAVSIGDADLAESIAQDCLLKAYNSRANFRGDCAVSTWLFSIANNLVRDQIRSQKFQFWRKARATSLDATEVASYLPSGDCSAERTMLARERVRQVSSAVGQLSVNQRRVFLLRFSEEMEISEIAVAMGMPLNTVKTHLRRAVLAIRSRLAEETSQTGLTGQTGEAK